MYRPDLERRDFTQQRKKQGGAHAHSLSASTSGQGRTRPLHKTTHVYVIDSKSFTSQLVYHLRCTGCGWAQRAHENKQIQQHAPDSKRNRKRQLNVKTHVVAVVTCLTGYRGIRQGKTRIHGGLGALPRVDFFLLINEKTPGAGFANSRGSGLNARH